MCVCVCLTLGDTERQARGRHFRTTATRVVFSGHSTGQKMLWKWVGYKLNLTSKNSHCCPHQRVLLRFALPARSCSHLGFSSQLGKLLFLLLTLFMQSPLLLLQLLLLILQEAHGLNQLLLLSVGLLHLLLQRQRESIEVCVFMQVRLCVCVCVYRCRAWFSLSDVPPGIRSWWSPPGCPSCTHPPQSAARPLRGSEPGTGRACWPLGSPPCGSHSRTGRTPHHRWVRSILREEHNNQHHKQSRARGSFWTGPKYLGSYQVA